MPGIGQIFFQQHLVIRESRFGFTFDAGQCLGKFTAGLDHTHAPAASTSTGLDQYRIGYFVSMLLEGRNTLISAMVTRQLRDTCLAHQLFGLRLRSHGGDCISGGAHKDQSGVAYFACKPGVF